MADEISRLKALRILRILLLAAAAAVIWLALIDIPQPTDASLDGAWQSVMYEAHAHHWQFGKQVIFTFGPWGFLTAHFVPPAGMMVRAVWEIAAKLALALGFVALSAGLSRLRRAAFLAALAVFLPLFLDTASLLFIALAVLEWLFEPEISPALVAAALAALAFLSQVKFTFCLVSAAGVGLAALSLGMRGHWRRAAATAGGFAAAFLILWVAAGQNPVKLPSFLRYSWEVAMGYSGAMGLDETMSVFLWGAGAMLLNLRFAVQLWRRGNNRALLWPMAVFLAAAWFLAWKHGFTRADDHVLGFFCFSLLMALALPGRPILGARANWLYANVACCCAGMWCADPGLIAQVPRLFGYHLEWSAQDLLHPAAFRRDFLRAAGQVRKAAERPQLRAAVGGATIDLIDYEQGILLLNGLNYDPRPIFQSYSTYTPRLLSKNLGFYQSPNAPDFVLVRLGAIDGRLAAEDDSLVLAEIPRRYDIASVTDDGILFRRKAVPPPSRFFSHDQVLETTVGLGTEIQVPPPDGCAEWLEADFEMTRLGRLRTLFYKPPQVFLVAIDDRNREHRFRVIPGITAEGFLLQPLLDSPGDYAAFARGVGRTSVSRIRFEAAPGESEFWTQCTARLFRIPELPAAPATPGSAP